MCHKNIDWCVATEMYSTSAQAVPRTGQASHTAHSNALAAYSAGRFSLTKVCCLEHSKSLPKSTARPYLVPLTGESQVQQFAQKRCMPSLAFMNAYDELSLLLHCHQPSRFTPGSDIRPRFPRSCSATFLRCWHPSPRRWQHSQSSA